MWLALDPNSVNSIRGFIAPLDTIREPEVAEAAIVPVVPSQNVIPQNNDRHRERPVPERDRFDSSAEAPLRRRVTAGFMIALLLTIVLCFSSWLGARRVATDVGWVAHTYQVMGMIQSLLRNVSDNAASARTFSLTGEDQILARYRTTRETAQRDADALRMLTADNPRQQRALSILDPQVQAVFEFSDAIIAKRRVTPAYRGDKDALEVEARLAAVRITTENMVAEETRLLAERDRKVPGSERRVKFAVVALTLVGVVLWTLAWLAVRREIGVSERTRGQLRILNSELEARVEQRTRALREQAQVLDLAQVLVRGLDGRISLWSWGSKNFYGYAQEEALGQISHELLHTEFPAPLDEIEQTLLHEGVWQGELIHRKKDGSQVFVTSVWMLHRDAAGNPLRVLESNTDITERKQAESQLARQTEELLLSQQDLANQKLMLQSVLDSMTEGLVAADTDGKFLLWNPAAMNTIGMGAANVTPVQWAKHYGVFLEDTITPFPDERNPLARAIRGESSTAVMFVRNPELEQGVWLEVSANPLRDKAGNITGGVTAFRDITQRILDERHIRNLNEELEDRVQKRTAQLAEANKELEAFTYSVSHDLRAPLRHIAGFSGILLEEFAKELQPNALRYLQRIQDSTHRMGTLVDDLLKLARVGRQELNLQPTPLEPMVRDLIREMEPDTQGRQVEWKVGALPSVEADAGLLKQVFQNLLSNALKYSRPRAVAVIEIGQTWVDGQSTIFIKDNGVGFSMKYSDKLFGVFQRLHRQEDFEGTGVGLATVQRIVQKHGGKIWAEAELDKGATFYVALQMVDAGVTAKGAAL